MQIIHILKNQMPKMIKTKCSDRPLETEYRAKNTTPTIHFVLISWKGSKKSKIQLIEKNK